MLVCPIVPYQHSHAGLSGDLPANPYAVSRDAASVSSSMIWWMMPGPRPSRFSIILELEEKALTIDPKSAPPHAIYKLMIGSIVPRPIAFVSTLSVSGIRNLAPFSFFNGVPLENRPSFAFPSVAGLRRKDIPP